MVICRAMLLAEAAAAAQYSMVLVHFDRKKFSRKRRGKEGS